MSAEERIQQTILDILEGRLRVHDDSSGLCLQVTREIVQAALGLSYNSFYAARTHIVEENTTGIPWARDLQRSLREQGLGVPYDERRGGMLAFNWRIGRPQGHVAVMLSRDFLLENTSTKRGGLVSGKNRLTHISEWPYQDDVEIYRLPWSETK